MGAFFKELGTVELIDRKMGTFGFLGVNFCQNIGSVGNLSEDQSNGWLWNGLFTVAVLEGTGVNIKL